MNLKNAVALVTGGSAGIGYSIAKTLVESGAKVAITGRDKARLEKSAKELGALGIQADVSKEADVEHTYKEVLAKFSDLDILVNNAGVGVFKPLVDRTCAFQGRIRHQRHGSNADGPRGCQDFHQAESGEHH